MIRTTESVVLTLPISSSPTNPIQKKREKISDRQKSQERADTPNVGRHRRRRYDAAATTLPRPPIRECQAIKSLPRRAFLSSLIPTHGMLPLLQLSQPAERVRDSATRSEDVWLTFCNPRSLCSLHVFLTLSMEKKAKTTEKDDLQTCSSSVPRDIFPCCARGDSL